MPRHAKLDSEKYVEYILRPISYSFWQTRCQELGIKVLIVEDGASGHKKQTKTFRTEYGLDPYTIL